MYALFVSLILTSCVGASFAYISLPCLPEYPLTVHFCHPCPLKNTLIHSANWMQEALLNWHKRMDMRSILLKQSLYSPTKAHRTECWIVFALVITGVLDTGHTSLLIISAACTLGVQDHKLRGKGTKVSSYMYSPSLC